MRYQSVFSLAKGPERGSKIKTTPTTLIIPTPAKYHIKNCDPVLSHASKGPEGAWSLCLQPGCDEVSHPSLPCGVRGQETRHSSQPSNTEAPTPAVSVEVPGSLDFYPTWQLEPLSQLPFSTRVVSKAYWRSGLTVLLVRVNPLSHVTGATWEQ